MRPPTVLPTESVAPPMVLPTEKKYNKISQECVDSPVQTYIRTEIVDLTHGRETAATKTTLLAALATAAPSTRLRSRCLLHASFRTDRLTTRCAAASPALARWRALLSKCWGLWARLLLLVIAHLFGDEMGAEDEL